MKIFVVCKDYKKNAFSRKYNGGKIPFTRAIKVVMHLGILRKAEYRASTYTYLGSMKDDRETYCIFR